MLGRRLYRGIDIAETTLIGNLIGWTGSVSRQADMQRSLEPNCNRSHASGASLKEDRCPLLALDQDGVEDHAAGLGALACPGPSTLARTLGTYENVEHSARPELAQCQRQLLEAAPPRPGIALRGDDPAFRGLEEVIGVEVHGGVRCEA